MARALLAVVLVLLLPGVVRAALTESSSNPRYFENAAGQIVYLVGGYYGCELQDQCFGIAAEGASDWAGVIADMQTYNGNLVRMWTSEGGGSSVPNAVAPMPWNRSGTAGAPSGNKWDLSSLDIGNLTTPALNSTHFFERLRARVIDAQNRGIYVSIMLFHRFGWESAFGASGHPFKSSNNVNGVNGDTNADGNLYEVAAVSGPGYSFQLAYVTQVLDTVQDLDNVLIEICNECYDTSAMNAWQQAIIDHIHTVQASRAIKHPVGFSAITFFPSGGAGSQTIPFTSSAEWANNGDAAYATTPLVQSNLKPSILDSDHITGCPSISDNDWPWKTFTRGHNIWHIYCTADHAPSAGEQVILTRMGQTRSYAERMNLKTAVPSTTACTTQYALVGPTELLCFIPGGGATTVTLTTQGDYRVEWFNPATAATSVDAATIAHGTRVITPPFGGDAIAYLTLQVVTPPLGQVTTDGTSSASCFTCSSLSFTHNIGSGTDRAFYIAAHLVATNMSTVTVDGVAATRVGTVTSGTCVSGQYACVTEVWMTVGPTVGSRAVVITATGQGNISGGGLSFFGVHQTTPNGPGGIQFASGTSNFPTLTVASTSGGRVLGAVTMNATPGTISGGPGVTLVYAGPDAAGFAKIAFGHMAGTSSTLIGFSNADSQPFSIFAVPILPSSTSTASELLLWDDNALTETIFRLQWKHAAQPSYSDLVTLGQNNTSYQVGYSTEVNRCYRIRAENTGGNSAFSNELCASVTASGPIVPTLTRPTLGGGLADE